MLANSPARGLYEHLRELPLGIRVGGWELRLGLEAWINDGLMAVFFFVVGLEIKRELLVGELASPRKAALPVAAAAGGALLPALLFLALNRGGPDAAGWGIPMATDIAFAIGILALLGSRAPPWLKTFLTALAIADDLIAVVVIALFYTSGVRTGPLLSAGGLLLLMAAMNGLGVRRAAWYLLPAVGLWGAVFASGVHATVAGVAAAAMIPARAGSPPRRTLERLQRALDLYASSLSPGADDPRTPGDEATDRREAALEELEGATASWESPLFRLEHRLLPWTTFLVLPLFALANAGVHLPLGALGRAATSALTLGVVLGLVLGKPLGIAAGSWIAVRLGLARLPKSARWRELWGAGLLGGVGFTMSIFIATLAYGSGSGLDLAKLGILVGSGVSALAGFWVLRAVTGPVRAGSPRGSGG